MCINVPERLTPFTVIVDPAERVVSAPTEVKVTVTTSVTLAVPKLGVAVTAENDGGLLSTLKVVLGPAPVSVFPALSDEADEMEIPKVPFPVILEIVTVGLLVVPFETLTDPSAVPVLFNVIFPEVRFTLSAPEYVILYVTGPELVSTDEGTPILAVGGRLSTLKVVLGPAPVSELPTRSEDVAAAMVMPKVPFPVILEIVTVGLLVVPLETLTDPSADPVLLRVISPEVRLTVLAPE